jgi:hypothetical protein
VLSPLSHALVQGQSLTFQAWARDADGDALSFSWRVMGADHSAPVPMASGSSLRVSGSQVGIAEVEVSVTDGKAPPVHAVARLVVNGEMPTGTDMDGDGWPSGTSGLVDCDDGDAKVYPGAAESCGDRLDRNCDGAIRVSDCDDDSVTVEQGDCDDRNPNRHPSAPELCDSVDNDCDGTVDNGWSTASRCVQGAGECQSFGVIECARDGLSSLCAAPPKQPLPEQCDGLDNDCDGIVDESVCSTADAGVDASVSDGGVRDAGVVDAGGCSRSPESCDGFDNDCNGLVDDVMGPCTTVLPGQCSRGHLVCGPRGVECRPNEHPEICNRVDDDCDGETDEGLVCACDPSTPEHCQNGIDDDCDGLLDAADPSCTQSCAPTSTEYCYDRIDNDCDGKVDLGDADCAGSCQAQGPELCTDGMDNDCDQLVDAKDPDCAFSDVGESCENAHGVLLGEWNSASLVGRKDDIATSCYPDGADYVFRFEVREAGTYQVLYNGVQPAAWSVFSGVCDASRRDIKELACKEDTVLDLAVGSYFLVVEGPSAGGEFSVVVDHRYW